MDFDNSVQPVHGYLVQDSWFEGTLNYAFLCISLYLFLVLLC